ncbi:MAG: VWA domain-containing protein [Chloroflexota bacterium]
MDDRENARLVTWAGAAADVLAGGVAEFAHLVRSHGIAVTTGRIIDAQRSLCHIDVGRKDDFYHALRANLIARPDDIRVFDALFHRFWQGERPPGPRIEAPGDRDGKQHPDLRETGTSRSPTQMGNGGHTTPTGEDDGDDRLSYSALEVLVAKDFGALNPRELQQIQEIMARMAPKVLTVRSRRFRPGQAGSQLDFRRTLRQSLRAGGDMIDLSWRQRCRDTARLILLCDVSRSMEKYSRFLIQFMYTFQNELPRTETFIFSTHLTRLTTALRGRYLADALERAASASAGWSSGTKIGECLEQFISRERHSILDRRTVVVILSDGWDQGDPRRLGEQMAAIKRRSRLVIWLNPLLGDPRYQPLVSGIRAALPHIDLFLPCHNLATLQAFAAELRRV